VTTLVEFGAILRKLLLELEQRVLLGDYLPEFVRDVLDRLTRAFSISMFAIP
jgi:hypothetical protein